MKYLSALKNKDLSDKICLLRLDFNIEGNWRMIAVLPTIKFLIKKCHSIVIFSHRGRPQQQVQSQKFKVESLSLKPQAGQLSRLLKRKIIFIKDFDFVGIRREVLSAKKGSVFLLENLRFLEGEEKNSVVLAKQLAFLGEIYVNDSFAVSHRANASVAAITKFIPAYAGFELESEIKNLTKAIKDPKKPLIVILGGVKIEDKLQVYDNLKNKASKFLIGGALNKKLLNLKLKRALMPVDFSTEGGSASGGKKEKKKILDIGLETAKIYCKEIKKARTIIWNGPLGDIDKKKFQNGTKVVAKCIAGNNKAFKIVGGGETVIFLKKLKLDKKINFISTGGGAMLDFLAGKNLPGIAALEGEPRQRREVLK